ncbi:MAG: hypothetical protein LBD89_07610 [Tannerellaceae bacterium]|jgi:opacity protein-like surface antigen|nr:hypothetical protein [Tannerellaceae bacterium]
MRIFFIPLSAFVFLLGGACGIKAQEAGDFTPSGSPVVVLFADYTAGGPGEAAGFSLTRSRLGYRYRATPSLSGVSVLDINATQNGRGVNFHYAFLEWTRKKLSLSGGLVALAQFGVQEAFWGRRYVEKSFQDLYGFGPDSDLGVTLRYRFSSRFEADAALVNGKDVANASGGVRLNRLALGATLGPLTGLTLRAYFDTNRHSDLSIHVPAGENPAYEGQETTLALFAGYRNRHFSLGSEWNYRQAQDFISGDNRSGLSLYGGLPLGQKFDLYARYDRLDTDEATFITGLEYHPTGNLQLSPNYRYLRSLGGEGFHLFALNIGFSL